MVGIAISVPSQGEFQVSNVKNYNKRYHCVTGLKRARQILFQADQTAIVNFFLLVLTYSRDLGSYSLIYDPPLQLEVVCDALWGMNR